MYKCVLIEGQKVLLCHFKINISTRYCTASLINNLYKYIYIYIYICIYVHTHIYIHLYIHIHIHEQEII